MPRSTRSSACRWSGLVVGGGAAVDRLPAPARKITWLNSLAEWAGRKFKRPPWVALPMALFIATLICALFGFIWDVSLHIGNGRDSGPLANPAHYFILFGLFLLFIAGCLACVLPYDKPGPSAVRITRNWYAPVGGVADGRLRPVRAASVSRSTTSGTASSARTSRCGGRRT